MKLIFGKMGCGMKRICLIGFMGSGKTTVGEALAKQLDVPWFDLDTYIVQQTSKSVSQIFSESGESHFRKLETFYLQQVLDEKEGVISTGGGIITTPKNIEKLRKEATIYLAYPFDTLYKRIAGDTTRPLATSYEALKERFDSRLALYEAACQVKINCQGKSINYIAEEIINKISKLERIS